MTKQLSTEAIELLRKAVARAKEIPTGFDMSRWVIPSSASPCGTAGCLAFEICVVSGHNPSDLRSLPWEEEIPMRALKLLGQEVSNDRDIADDEVYKYGLFLVGFWPTDLQDKYENTSLYSPEKALVLEQAVERWIKGDGSFEKSN